MNALLSETIARAVCCALSKYYSGLPDNYTITQAGYDSDNYRHAHHDAKEFRELMTRTVEKVLANYDHCDNPDSLMPE